MSRSLFLQAVLFGAVLLGACSRSDAPPSATATATPAGSAHDTATASPAPPTAVLREVPPEDRLEPVAIDQARLPGGGALPADPTESAPTKKKTAP